MPVARRTAPSQVDTTTRSRIVALDVARGIAILGTLATNIWIFSHPGGMLGYLDSPTTPGVAPPVALIEHVLMQVANGKFLGLLTLMFGIGLAIQAESAARAGRTWPGSYLWRSAILFLDGLLHYLLVVEFDVLMGYAVTGAVVAYVIGCSERVRRVCLGASLTVHVALVSLLTAASWWLGDAAIGSSYGQEAYRSGSWWDLVLLRLDNGAAFRFEPVFLFFGGVAMFLLGHRLFLAGIFRVEGAGLRGRLMVLGAVVFPVDLALGLTSPAWLWVTRYGTAFCVALGLLAAVVQFADGLGWWQRRAAEIGRVALSAYVMQNLIASALFYGWGLDLGSLASQWRLPVTVTAWFLISGLVAGAAHLWLLRFHRGPLEWTWNRMAWWLSRA